MGNEQADSEAAPSLIRDFERIAALGIKRTLDLATAPEGTRAALDRLIEADLALELNGAVLLMRPDDSHMQIDEARLEDMRANYASWLRADRLPVSGELLYGEPGFWQHWWNRIRERDHDSLGPLQMDFVVPDDGTFSSRAWLAEFDPEVRSHVLDGGLLRGRVIVPPDAIRSVVEPMLDLSTESGIEVRVLSTGARFVLYDSAIAILNPPGEPHGDGAHGFPEPYWAVGSEELVHLLRQFFEQLWEMATPYRAHRGEHDEILKLLACGHTDAQIAEKLNVSHRTVSRRVADLMDEFGASSRFELGMRYEKIRSER